jgi:hypothetical protein
MNARRIISACVVAVFLFFIAAYLLRPSVAPQGQPPLITLSRQNFASFQNAFDSNSGPRLLLLLSPT